MYKKTAELYDEFKSFKKVAKKTLKKCQWSSERK
jgi:hypothetical protein